MSAELRKKFEVELQQHLKEKFLTNKYVKKVNRKEIHMQAGDATATIYITHYKTGYGLSLHVSVPELHDFTNEVSAPYPPKFPPNILDFIADTGNDERNMFGGSISGTYIVPQTDEGRTKACKWIGNWIEDEYLPVAINLMELRPEAIDDMLKYPECSRRYNYPFLTILYLIKKNNIPLSCLNMDKILSKNILGDKKFDLDFMNSYLELE